MIGANIIAVASAFALATLFTWLMIRYAEKLGMMDSPNHRSLHEVPTPRSGGLAICIGIAVGFAYLIATDGNVPLIWLFGCAASVALISFLDDKYSLPPAPRMLVHLTAAAFFTLGVGMPTHLALPGIFWAWPPMVAIVFTILFIAWMVNLYNFMDGMDGFAGGMTVVGFSCYAVIGALANAPSFSTASAVIAASALGLSLIHI